MTNVIDLMAHRPVVGLTPVMYPAALIERPCHLQCGACGFSGMVEFYVHGDSTDPFEPVCNCPLPATLEA